MSTKLPSDLITRSTRTGEAFLELQFSTKPVTTMVTQERDRLYIEHVNQIDKYGVGRLHDYKFQKIYILMVSYGFFEVSDTWQKCLMHR